MKLILLLGLVALAFAASAFEEDHKTQDDSLEGVTEEPGAGPGFSRFPADPINKNARLPMDGVNAAICPNFTDKQRRAQRMFQALLKSMSKRLKRTQPWNDWATKIIACSLGKDLFQALSPAEQVNLQTETSAILKAELRVRQHEDALAAMQRDPCNPFVSSRAAMNTIIDFRRTIMENACKK